MEQQDPDAALGAICFFIFAAIVCVILFFATNGFERKRDIRMFEMVPRHSQE